MGYRFHKNRTYIVVWVECLSITQEQTSEHHSQKTNGRCESFYDKEVRLPTHMPNMKDNQETLC